VSHVLSTGQSNAVANDGVPVLSTTQPFSNVMFDVGIMTAADCDRDGCRTYQKPTSFVPLVEGDSFWYPVETMSAGLANEAAELAGDKRHAVLVTLHGRSGNTYWCLRKGGCDYHEGKGYVEPFEEAMMQVADAKRLADAAGKTYVVRAVTAVHGEADHYMYTDHAVEYPLPGTDGKSVIHDYGEGLVEWQRDYEEGVRAITHQSILVPLLVSQYSHWNDAPHSNVPYLQLRAHVSAPGKVVVVGPTYALPYGPDCLHFTNEGERHLGEYFAKAYARIVVEGRRWEPVRPKSVTRDGGVITIRYVVQKPPLVIDTERVTDPGDYGFEYADDSGAPPAIARVELAGPDAIRVTLAAAPTGANKRIRYAYTYHGCPGPVGGARGNVRDSDAAPSVDGYDLFDWSVHFDEPVP
jgi:hypothetical protein